MVIQKNNGGTAMEKPLKFKQLFMSNPNSDNSYTDYQKKLQPRMKFEPASLEQLYLKHQDAMIETTMKECERYLNDEAWMEEDTFPRVQELTGEWYLASISMRETTRGIRVGVYTHFLGYYPKGCAKEETDDYLGMEAWFDYDPAKDAFIFDCFDTASI